MQYRVGLSSSSNYLMCSNYWHRIGIERGVLAFRPLQGLKYPGMDINNTRYILQPSAKCVLHQYISEVNSRLSSVSLFVQRGPESDHFRHNSAANNGGDTH